MNRLNLYVLFCPYFKTRIVYLRVFVQNCLVEMFIFIRIIAVRIALSYRLFENATDELQS